MISDRKIYFDMDGVLDDFVKGCNDLGLTFKNRHLVQKNAWEIIDSKGKDFWIDLHWVRGSRDLFRFVANNFKYVEILTARAMSEDCVVGKKIWCKRNLEPLAKSLKVNIVWKNQKSSFAYNNILIDDDMENIKGWCEAGGIGHLFKNAEETKTWIKNFIKQ